MQAPPTAQAAADATATTTGSRDSIEQYPLPPSTVDSRSYTDPAQYRREIEKVFHSAWLRACPASDIANPGDWSVFSELDQSIVIARQDDGSVLAWHNVCQHRGARLVAGESGHCESGRFTCPWHGFIYDLTGKLRFAPMKTAFDPDRIAALRTPPVRAEEYGGFVWLCLSSDTKDLKTYLGDIGTELDWFGLETFDVRYRFDLVLDANWKVVVDAFNETWHVPFTHQATLSEIVQWGKARLRICDPHSWMTIPVKGLTDRHPDDADHRASHITHYLAFPNTIYSNFPTHLQTWTMWPAGPGKTHFVAYGMVGPCPEGISEEKWVRQNDRDWQNFQDVASEDCNIINGWGTVAHSLGQGEYLFNTAEGRLTAFHREIGRRTAAGA
ncbi:aromatic ring-hydroxylating oxygenase subunit alpha [Novosphingobium lentum]|uniref:aromatic ring-hydroxylating oxygenase subunit alpha n=1 Tax=Novosphingobium lentum TaxID=145287 RepID=UPI000ABF7D9C|nr:aromatic ring-hydroxylating dioxygenase subunit alpha [Novosphingobium lentum]